MDQDSEHPKNGSSSTTKTPSSGGRRHACDRCQRQKLKCDIEKPCLLCVRSGSACTTTARTTKTTSGASRKSKQTRRKAARQGTAAPSALGTPSATPTDWDSGPSNSRTINFLDRLQTPNHDEKGLHSETALSNSLHDDDTISRRTTPFPEPHKYAEMSAIGLTSKLFHIHKQASINSSVESYSTNAIPGGNFVNTQNKDRQTVESVSLDSLFPGFTFPPRPICDFLVESYRKSVHWFMMLFHEASFESEYKKVMDSQVASPRQLGIVVLFLTVFTMGARYTTDDEALEACGPNLDLGSLQQQMLKEVQAHLLDVIDIGGVESVQICVLLSSFYMYNGRPNLALAILGAGVQSSQAIGLHKESLWGPLTETAKEVRRRAWWALYVLDRFSSITYGRPLSINDSDCDVRMPGKMDDVSKVHPLLNSLEHVDANSPTQVTLNSYHRFKFALYTIASPIIGGIYNLKKSNPSNMVQQAILINTNLVRWFDQLPPELKLDSNTDLDVTNLPASEVKICRLFQLQALALQLAYDNIQIILHRPFLQYNHCLAVLPTSATSDLRPTSLEQSRHCARRTCNISPRYANLLLAARDTHAVAYVAIQNFTAGVTLGMVALSDPGSEQAQDAKRGVSNSISLQRMLAVSSIVPLQTVKVLEELFRLIFKREMEVMLGGPPLNLEPGTVSSSFSQHEQGINESPRHPVQNKTALPKSPPLQTSQTVVMDPLQASCETGDKQSQATEMRSAQELGNGMDWGNWSFDSGIDNALESIQQVLWQNSHPTTSSETLSMNTTGSCGNAYGPQRQVAVDDSKNSTTLPPEVQSFGINDTLGQGSCDLYGQSWMWNWDPSAGDKGPNFG
ncbi:hypothetical protein BCIN_02g01900 [Botrytis cinerea B05.10]|uniref:Zn(2)-C6 fungal-type domain-containing protein n=1 Tax=Botryotinia fuckeliana (strain B05.10) TaxID=332648 RepID=A0A384J8S3_BOTFB|nr:hypothetical protein BCIN_02g01900 [Botrytis cinerea B05.10]ATZ46842.1 hypothetical protein BCIN_02g01900 [Botrytis cinerea B05.10]